MNLRNFTLKATLLFSTLLFLNVINAQVQTPISTPVSAVCGGYYEGLPSDYNSTTTKYPLMVFFHGIGEEGNGTTDLPTVLRNGPPKLLSQGTFPASFTVGGKTFKFIVISPQFTRSIGPDDVNYVIDYMVKKYRVDTTRIYLTGLSLGGGFVWNYVGHTLGYASRPAAIVPVSGASTPTVFKCNNIATANLPVWAFHNLNDPTVNSGNTINYIKMINANVPAPKIPARATIFNASGHDSWDQAYDPNYRENGMNCYEWMLQYQKGVTAPTTPVAPNKVPVAKAGSDVTITLPTNSTALSGSGTDSDGTVTTYAWTEVSGPTQFTFSSTSVANPTVTNLSSGVYTFRLTVTDNSGATATDDVAITVNAPAAVALPGTVDASNFTAMSGVQTEATTDSAGGLDVGWIDNGDWMTYNVNVSAAGTYNVNFRVASPNTGGQFQVKNAAGTVLATVNVPLTGGYQTWVSVSSSLLLTAGKQILTIYTVTGGFNFNWFAAATPTTNITTTKLLNIGLTKTNTAYSDKTWNNWNVGAAVASNLTSGSFKYSDGTVSTVTAALSFSQTVSDNGLSYGSGMAPKEILKYTSYSAAARTLKVTGLTIGKKYSVDLYASRAKNVMSTVFTVGSLSETIATYNNYTNAAEFINLSPDASGTITIALKSVGLYNYLNGFSITEITTTSASAKSETTDKKGEVAAVDNSKMDVTEEKSPEISVYPNPIQDRLTVQLNNKYTGNVNVQIVDISGHVKKQLNVSKTDTRSQVEIYAKELSAGTYILRVQMGNWAGSKKLLKL